MNKKVLSYLTSHIHLCGNLEPDRYPDDLREMMFQSWTYSASLKAVKKYDIDMGELYQEIRMFRLTGIMSSELKRLLLLDVDGLISFSIVELIRINMNWIKHKFFQIIKKKE